MMSEASEQHQIDAMASAMLMYGNQYDPDGLAAFVEDYPDLAKPAHLRESAWALSVRWLNELPTRTTAAKEVGR